MPIDPFDPGTSVAQEFPTQEPDTLRRLWQIIAAQKRAMFDLRASVLANVSDVVADLTAKQATLTDLVSKVVVLDSDWGAATGFSVPAAFTEQASCTLVVPAGFTKMQFSAVGTVQARNDSGSTQYLLGRIYRQTNGAGALHASEDDQLTLPNGYWGVASTFYVWNESVTPGDSHRFWVSSWAGLAFSADPGHRARIVAAATFTR